MTKSKMKMVFIGLAAVLGILLILFLYLKNAENSTDNHVNDLRLESNALYSQLTLLWPIDDEDIEVIEKELGPEIYITIVTLSDTIIYSNSRTIDKTGNKLLLEALYMDNSYTINYENMFKISQPIYQNNQVVAFAVFEKYYDTKNKGIITGQAITLSFISLILIAFILMSGFLIFGKHRSELLLLEEGLNNISKGILKPITVPRSNQFFDIYNIYNSLIEELTYIMKQQQTYDGQRKAFLTMISHELKTPIATINAHVEGLISGIGEDDETKERYLNVIFNKMQQLTKQVEDFFKYTQEEVNRFKYNFEECYADELIEKIFSSIKSTRQVSVETQNLLPKCIFKADKVRLEQVVMNLYNNSVKHTSPEDPIILRAYREDENVVIEIEDKGEGINPRDLPYIFDYYYQGQSSQQSDYEGIGLGLAICKNIIDNHNGSIKVKSNINEGTTVSIKIPLV